MSGDGLGRYGFGGRFAAEAALYPEFYAGRILAQEKGLYRVICGSGELLAEVSGRMRFDAASPSDYPAAGDYVLIDRSGGDAGNAIIRRILKRKSAFIRKAAGKTGEEQVVAANIDTVFLCMALDGDFNLRRLERYLSLAWESGALPVVVLTKADLCDSLGDKLRAAGTVAPGVDILVTDSAEEEGHLEVLEYIDPGCTVALIGSSGVGKSTLINRLMGAERLATGAVRSDGRGRHTTVRRELVLLPDGGIVIDTPGMRELGMWHDSEGLGQSFSDVESCFGACRFTDCTHTAEPGCAVWAAIERGELSPERWASYRKLKTEAEYAEDRNAYLMRKEQKFKDIAKFIRSEVDPDKKR
jgi:ribosome biogenesis GTPase